MTSQRMTERLTQLRQDLATGRERLGQLDQQRTQLTETLLRIAGAVQVLEELLAMPEPEPETALEATL